MAYPIVQVETADGLWLHGLYLPTEKKETAFIFVHGTASNFYTEDFIEPLAEALSKRRMALLSTNNRGADVFDAWEGRTGAAVEIFEECLLDIDAWAKFALDEGYKAIVLAGHSLGTEKVVYYMAKGVYRDKISAVVLLAPADSPRWRSYDSSRKVLGTGETGKARVDLQVRDAEKLVSEGKGDELMIRSAYSGKMPKTPRSLLNFLGEGTEILKSLPFHSGKLDMYASIRVPIFVAIGDQEEYTGIPIRDALELMRKENPRTETVQLKGCDHVFTDCEDALAQKLSGFIDTHKLA